MKKFHFKVISPDKVLFDGDCISVKFPVYDGVYEIMCGYVPTVFDVFPGSVVIRLLDGEQVIDTNGGILTVKKEVSILTL